MGETDNYRLDIEIKAQKDVVFGWVGRAFRHSTPN